MDRLSRNDTDAERVRLTLPLRLDSFLSLAGRSLAGLDESLERRVCSRLGSLLLLDDSLLRGSLLGSLLRRLLDRFSFNFRSSGPAEDDRLCLRSSSLEMVMPPTTDADEGVWDRRLRLLAELITL